MQTNIHSPKSICLLRLSAIGDVCHAVATVQAIQQQWPSAQITWVIGKIEFQLLEGLPGVRFVVFDKKAGLKGYRELRRHLKHDYFDILLHMQVALRASLATLCIKARETWGFDRSRAKEAQWLFTNRQIDSQQSPHVVDGFLGFAKAIGVSNQVKAHWNMPLSLREREWQACRFADIGKYIVIAPAASKAERNWLPEGYAAFANYVAQKNLAVVICGGPSKMEKELADRIVSFCDFNPINLVGETSLKQLLAVISEAEMLLAPDTGPTHMAVTVSTPVIGLYVHSNPLRTGPYHYRNYVVSLYEELLMEQTGQASKEHLWGKRVKGEGLMKRIEVDSVINSFNRLAEDFRLF